MREREKRVNERDRQTDRDREGTGMREKRRGDLMYDHGHLFFREPFPSG